MDVKRVLPDSECEQVWSQQGGAEDEEKIGGEDSPLHHLRLPDAERALLLRMLEHKLSADRGREDEESTLCRETERGSAKGESRNK